MLEVANLILVVGEDATVHDVSKKFRCKQCNVKGENTFQIVWRGNSDIALDGAGVRPPRDGPKGSPPSTSQNYIKITELLLVFSLPNVY